MKSIVGDIHLMRRKKQKEVVFLYRTNKKNCNRHIDVETLANRKRKAIQLLSLIKQNMKFKKEKKKFIGSK